MIFFKVEPRTMTKICVDGLIFLSFFIFRTASQFNYCLTPTGCFYDECCFRIVPRTGPICVKSNDCLRSDFPPECCLNQVKAHTDYGVFYGYSILLDDFYEFRKNGVKYLHVWKGVPYAQPATKERNRRFKRPLKLEKSNDKIDTTKFKPICAQPRFRKEDAFNSSSWTSRAYEWIRRMPPHMAEETEQISEDCLYMNIYSITESYIQFSTAAQRRLPIMVFFSSHDHINGNVNQFPGHLLAQLGLIVITVSHRLGPFGYLSTQNLQNNDNNLNDESFDTVLGNYALWDQIMALEFIRENAHHFFGDANQITLVGHGSSAADVTGHIFSPKSGLASPPLFQRAILVDGAGDMEGGIENPSVKLFDYSDWIYSKNSEPWNSGGIAYSAQLGYNVGCDVKSTRELINCLRSRSWDELSEASINLNIHREGWAKVKPWSLVIDRVLIPDTIDSLWKKGEFAKIPLMGILSTEGAAFDALANLYKLNKLTAQYLPYEDENGQVKPLNDNFRYIPDVFEIFRGFEEMSRHDFAKALMEMYSRVPELTPKQPLLWNYIQAYTDRKIGQGMMRTLRRHSSYGLISPLSFKEKNLTTLMIFPYKSENDSWAKQLGAYGGSVLQYIFGFPRFFYATWANLKSREEFLRWKNELGLVPPSDDLYSYNRDMNISDYMMSLISNFVIQANATPVPVRNITWDTFRPDNRTYLWVNLSSIYNRSLSNRLDWEMEDYGAGFDLRQNWRTQEYGFWTEIYERLLRRPPRYPLLQPIARFLEGYRYAAISMSMIIVILILLIFALAILINERRKMLIRR